MRTLPMDNPYYDWSPLVARPPLRWPGEARVAFCVIVNLEQIEWLPPRDAVIPPSAVRYGPYPIIYDIHEISHHEYGNRVGVFRIMDVLERHGVKATAAMDALIAEENAFLVERCRRLGWELMGHGVSFARMISERMSEDEERAAISLTLEAVARAAGQRPVGWHGPDYGESMRTPRLLAELGIRYVCDWPNDEQPYRMKVPAGELVSLPIMHELDDVHALRERAISVDRWRAAAIEAFDRMHEDGAESGRLFVLNLHPYVIGQPFRIRYLEEVVRHIAEKDGVWTATAREIADWYLGQTP
jgi:allantoinase